MIEGARRLNQALAGEAHGVTTLPEQSTLPVINRAAMPAPAVQAGGQRGGDYGRGGLPVGNGRQPRRGATAPRAPFIVARLLPHFLVLAIVIAVVAGGGFWNPAVRVGPLRLETGQHPDLSVPVVQSSTNTSPAPVEQDAGTSYFTRPPLAITSTHLRIATYETKDGETINQIAARLGLKPATLLWANNLQDPAKPLLQGTKLRVPPTDGMLHQVQSNDTLDGIAAKYKVSTTAITGYRPNNVGGPDDLVPQSYVLVVGGQIPTREKVEPYTVRNGDTLWSIADRFGLSPSTLVWANNITNADVLVVGQTLIIPPVNGILHHVEQGETVAGLASKYSVKPEDITSFAPNGLGGGSPLVPGQDVMVPGGTPPAPPPPVVAAAPDPAAAPSGCASHCPSRRAGARAGRASPNPGQRAFYLAGDRRADDLLWRQPGVLRARWP